MTNKVKEVVKEEVNNKEEHFKIGEILIIENKEMEKPNGVLAFLLSEGLTEQLDREENEDLRLRMKNIVDDMQATLLDLQTRGK